MVFFHRFCSAGTEDSCSGTRALYLQNNPGEHNGRGVWWWEGPENIIKKFLAEDGFDPSTSGLWAQHAPTAPLCLLTVIAYFQVFIMKVSSDAIPTGCHGDSSCTILPCDFTKIYTKYNGWCNAFGCYGYHAFILMIMHKFNINIIHNTVEFLQDFCT